MLYFLIVLQENWEGKWAQLTTEKILSPYCKDIK